MKILKYSVVPALFGLMMTTGCKKDLELYPTDTFTPINAFRTVADAQLGVNEAYDRFGTRSNTSYQSGLLSDEAKLGRDNSGGGALTYRYQFSYDPTTGGDVTPAFGGFYYCIDQVNRVLGALPGLVIANPAEEARRNVLRGQLLALRAIAHYEILQSYAKNYSASDPKGIAYMLASDAGAKPARETIGSVVTKIETDLADAFALLPAVTATSFTDTVMNQVNINAYRARIALYKGDYQNAINYASAVITSAVRPIATGANYTGIWTDANVGSEVLFRIRYATATDGAIGAAWTTTGAAILIAPSDKLRLSYAAADIRRAAFIAGTGPDGYYVNKLFASSRGGRVVDLKISRISEMYLIRAEAYAKLATPNIAAGTADLNTVRTNRITGYVPATFNSAAELNTAVLDERFKELCFEGFRFWDLKRNNLPVQRAASDVGSPAWQTLPANDYRFVLPIPQYEMLANPNMVQNDGYQ